MQNQKGFILPIIIAVVIIAILGAGGYFAYRQYFFSKPAETGPTADWKIYKNDKYGFQAKYPLYFEPDPHLPSEYTDDEAWFVNRHDDNQIINLIMKGPVEFSGEEKLLSFADYGVDYDNKKYTCIGFCEGEILKLPAIPEKKSVTFISIGTTPGVLDAYVKTLIEKDQKTMIEISIYGNDSRKKIKEEDSYRLQLLREKMINLNDQILSTFKFTK